MKKEQSLSQLPFNEWKETRMTLHLILQIIGKVRLKMTPRKNHWWFITEYVSVNGFSTSSIPHPDGLNSFEIIFDVHKMEVRIASSFEQPVVIPLKEGLTIAEFYSKFEKALQNLKVEPNLIDKPFDLGIDQRFSEITEFHHFDQDYILKFWKILLWIDGVFNEFGGRFYGKTCPVQIYWHHMDLAMTRFSGKKAPPMDPSARVSDKDAYSHEVISFGFWPGDDQVQQPTFYAYAYPSPDGLGDEQLKPEFANWVDNNGSPMATLSYHELIETEDPRSTLLDFMESSYQAGAKLAGWPIDELKTPDLKDL